MMMALEVKDIVEDASPPQLHAFIKSHLGLGGVRPGESPLTTWTLL